MLGNPVRGEEWRKPHRTTIYLSSKHHSQIEEEVLNLSEFVREKLDEYFTSEDTIEEKCAHLKLRLKSIKRDVSQMNSQKKLIKEQLIKFAKKIEELKIKKEQLVRLGISKIEYNFLTSSNERTDSLNNYNETFKKNLRYSEFLALIKKVKET